MRWLVTGARGMLGQDLVERLRTGGHDVLGIDRDEADVTDLGAMVEAVTGRDVVVNCAAWTAVDAAEEHEADAFTVNAVGAATVARAAAAQGARVVQISTDYVFDGVARAPYAEDEPVRPQSAYGRTKAAGEWAVRAEALDHLIVRTAWLYGAHGGCFPRTIARVARERTLDVVDDQRGQPTWTVDLADLVVRMVEADVPAGTYHGTSSGITSWFEFARSVVEASGLDPLLVRPTSGDGAQRAARRPAYSALAHGALEAVGVEPIGAWDERWLVAAPAVLAEI